MTDPNKTLIGVVIDRSGSMSTIKKDMEGGLKQLIEEQKKLPGECLVTLSQFDGHYDTVYGFTPIEDVKDYVLVPRGSTAMFDGIGRAITEIGLTLAALEEDQRPGHVIMVIITDGEENASREWKGSAIRDLIKEQQEKYGWVFTFLGANIDAETVGMNLGIDRGSTLTYQASTAGVGNTMSSLSNYMGATRSGVSARFTDQDRQSATQK